MIIMGHQCLPEEAPHCFVRRLYAVKLQQVLGPRVTIIADDPFVSFKYPDAENGNLNSSNQGFESSQGQILDWPNASIRHIRAVYNPIPQPSHKQAQLHAQALSRPTREYPTSDQITRTHPSYAPPPPLPTSCHDVQGTLRPRSHPVGPSQDEQPGSGSSGSHITTIDGVPTSKRQCTDECESKGKLSRAGEPGSARGCSTAHACTHIHRRRSAGVDKGHIHIHPGSASSSPSQPADDGGDDDSGPTASSTLGPYQTDPTTGDFPKAW